MKRRRDPVEETRSRWLKALSSSPSRKSEFSSEDGIEFRPMYEPKDSNEDYLQNLGYPGFPPFTRGVYPTMYRGRAWTMRQYSGYANAELTNRRYRLLLQAGETGLSMAFDLPTQLGLDPDDPLAYYEVGRVGVPVPSWKEMDIVFRGINVEKVSTSMTINATAMEELAMYVTVAKSRGVDLRVLAGTTQNDILKEFIARNNYIYPPSPSMRYCADLISYCAKNMPKWNGISISGYHFEEAGATPSQEIAFTLADGIAYVEEVLRRGMSVDEFAPRLSFFFSSRTNLIEQVAKFRAARRLWCRVMEERFGAKDPKSKMLRFHVQTAGVQMTSQQLDLNIVRTTLQALAAVLGGAQSLHVNSYDEALGLPTEHAARLSVRVQQALLLETDVADSIDPLGGSYMVESLTDELEERAVKIMKDIDRIGGMVRAVETGFPQKAIEESSYRYQKMVESGQKPVIGINIFKEDEPENFEPLKIDPAARKKVISRLESLKRDRDGSRVSHSLSALTRAAEGDDNLFEYILKAVEAGATVGEISGALRDVWGVWDRR
ncbi:MAG: methylmalonyl-CoA mutase [Nitrososphaerota archaeon]|nr:methylmalonyl-CoA mutase [Nitrososphaerota archaeon]